MAEVDHKSALVAWEGEAAMYQLEYRKEGEYVGQGMFSSPEESFRIGGLTAEVRYEVRVRSVCGASDTSDWSLYVPFVTLQAPACPEPVNLRTESITATSANLKWGSPEEGASFILRYSLASPVSWDSVHVMTDTVFLLEDLQPETVYLWSVMSSCLGGNHSGWATRQNFETSPVANEKDDSHGLHVYTTPGQLHLLNPAALPLGRVWIYGTDGHLHGCYQVDSTENVLIRTELSMQVAIVLVESRKPRPDIPLQGIGLLMESHRISEVKKCSFRWFWLLQAPGNFPGAWLLCLGRFGLGLPSSGLRLCPNPMARAG